MLVLHLNCWRILQSKKVKNTLSYEKCILKWYLLSGLQIRVRNENLFFLYPIHTGGKPRNYHEIVLTQICSQATSGTRRGSFQAENWIKKGWCHVHFCFILQLRTNNGEIRQCSSV